MMCSTLGCFAAENDAVLISEEAGVVGEITLQIGNPMMTVSGKSVTAQKEIPQRLRYRQLLKMNEKGVEILESNA